MPTRPRPCGSPLLTSQAPPLANGQPNPNAAIRAEKPVELAAKATDAEVPVLVPPELSADGYDVAVQADLLAADKRTTLATAFTPVRRTRRQAAGRDQARRSGDRRGEARPEGRGDRRGQRPGRAPEWLQGRSHRDVVRASAGRPRRPGNREGRGQQVRREDRRPADHAARRDEGPQARRHRRPRPEAAQPARPQPRRGPDARRPGRKEASHASRVGSASDRRSRMPGRPARPRRRRPGRRPGSCPPAAVGNPPPPPPALAPGARHDRGRLLASTSRSQATFAVANPKVAVVEPTAGSARSARVRRP